jgi:hypothetical protein
LQGVSFKAHPSFREEEFDKVIELGLTNVILQPNEANSSIWDSSESAEPESCPEAFANLKSSEISDESSITAHPGGNVPPLNSPIRELDCLSVKVINLSFHEGQSLRRRPPFSLMRERGHPHPLTHMIPKPRDQPVS